MIYGPRQQIPNEEAWITPTAAGRSAAGTARRDLTPGSFPRVVADAPNGAPIGRIWTRLGNGGTNPLSVQFHITMLPVTS